MLKIGESQLPRGQGGMKASPGLEIYRAHAPHVPSASTVLR